MINRYLSGMSDITPADMQKMQTDNYNLFAETALPVMLKYIDRNKLNDAEKKYLGIISSWNKRNDNEEQGPVIFTTWEDSLEAMVWVTNYQGHHSHRQCRNLIR